MTRKILADKNFLLIDFGASLMHTHHSRVIRGFMELIEQEGGTSTLYLPMGSEIANLGGVTFHRRILIPSYHPVGMLPSKPSTWIPGLMHVLYSRTENSRYQRILNHVLSSVIVGITFLQIRKEIQTQPTSIVVFPTACPISFRLCSKIMRKFERVKFVLRLTNTAERRGYFAKYFNLTTETLELTRLSSAKIRFGYEMEEYGSSLIFLQEHLHFSPTPPCLEIKRKSTDETMKSFGFLGMAQRHKGVNWLIEIINRTLLNSKANELSWIVQTEEPPPKEILELSSRANITILPGRLSETEMSNAFNRVDLICLPYDVDSYKLNASALAYRAADNLIAVATFKGSAFANEIQKFEIGIVVDDIEGLITGMSNFDTESTRARIFHYNQVRYQTNLKLLSW